MNKYLLCVLLSITSIPAHSASGYIYDYVEGTIDTSNYFAKDTSTQRAALDAYGEGLVYRTHEYKHTTPIPFTMQWQTTTSSDAVQFDPDAFLLRMAIPGIPAFEIYERGPNGGPIDMGEYTLPTKPLSTEYNCVVPQAVNTTRLIDGRVYLILTGKVGGTVPSGWASMNVTCVAYYELRQHVEITLADKEINLIGTQPNQLTGTTKMTVKGIGGPVTVEIDNPSLNDVSVSFEQDRIATTTRMNLTDYWQPHEQQIYVRGKTTKPGSHTYTVRLNASFK